MNSENVVATPVVDKNGKNTTVYKKFYNAPKNRVMDTIPKLSLEIHPSSHSHREHLQSIIEKAVVDINHPFIVKYRLPVIEGIYPKARFVNTLAAPAKNTIHGDYLEITEDEAALLGSYTAFRSYKWFYESEIAKMREMPLDLDGGVNTYSFAKKEDGWVYRAQTWQGQPFWPGRTDPMRFTNIIELLDHVEKNGDSISEKWTTWKLERELI